MRFVIDENLPPALAALLTELGHDAIHVAEAGLHGASDAAVAAYAVRERRTITTRDSDFDHRTDVSVLRIRLGNCDNAMLFAAVRRGLEEAIASLEANSAAFLPP